MDSPTGFESWMIIKKDTLKIIGDLGFKGFNHQQGSIDLGYGIIKEKRQKGYAFEAVNELILWALSNDIVKEITASCLLENQSSINLLNKFNFKQLSQDNSMVYWSLTNTKFK